MTDTAVVNRIKAPSGNKDNDRWQAVCTVCGWASKALYSNRTTEGRRLARRDADDHNGARHNG